MLLLPFILAVIGFIIAWYSYYVERSIKANPSYKPVCDLSDRVSCSKPITSSYGSLFYFSNALIGVAFYVVVAILALMQATTLLLIVSIAGVIASVFFAYILYVKIQALCLLCTALYIINGLLLYASITSF